MSLSRIKSEYEKNLIKEEEKIAEKYNKIYTKNPDIKEINEKIQKLDYERIKIVLLENYKKEKIEKISKKIKELENLKHQMINSLKLPKDYFKINYKCKICKDTGFVEINGKKERCKCITQRLLNERYNSSNLKKSSDETFENFNLKYYSDEKINGKSPRENAKEILLLSKEFVDNFNKKNNKNKNLLFLGETGLGKTYLSNAIAKEILKKGNTIFYQTSPVMLDELMINKFKEPDLYYDMLNQIQDVDLLILDDLGAENLSESKMKEIFTIINLRLINDKSTIISSNLNLEDMSKAYDDRIFSRIIGNYTIKKFIGKDIRIIKKQKNKKQQ